MQLLYFKGFLRTITVMLLTIFYHGSGFAQCNMTPSPDISLCHGDATSTIIFSGPTAGTTYSWTNNNTTMGLGASGTGNIAPFFALNGGPGVQVATIIVTPTSNGTVCVTDTFTITVNPIPNLAPIPDTVFCSGIQADIVFSSTSPGTTFDWTNTNTAIGIAATGVGHISFIPTNTGTTPITAQISPGAVNAGCENRGNNDFQITVNPSPIVNSIVDQVLCDNSVTNAVSFTDQLSGTTYAWTNDTPSIGLAANGSGNIASFTALNTSANPVIANITVTPTGTNGCVGSDITFTITVNPTPLANTIPDQILCANTATSAIAYTSATAGATFTWTNDTPSIGLAASGNGDIASFTTLNTTSSPIVATITVTPTANGCIGPDSTFMITVNPTPLVNTITDQVLCANSITNAITYSSATTGTTFTWTNDTPTIGLSASGNGDIASFTPLNTTSTPIIATITITPTASGCIGPDSTFTITVNPTPIANTIPNQTLCASTTTNPIAYTSSTPGTTFSWTNDTPSIGLAGNGNGDIASFTGLNTTANPIIATITITPTANGCQGPDSTFTITINPGPIVNTTSDQVLCTNTATNAITYSSATTGTNFAWTNDTPTIGLGASGNGNTASFTALNTTANPIVATITITGTGPDGCVGPDSTFTITVNPTPLPNSITDQVLCVNATTSTIAYTSATTGTTFAWTNDTPSIGLAANGNGDIALFTALNTTSNPIIATITVTPTANGCAGPDSTFTITVNPLPLSNSIADQVLCANSTTNAITYSSATTGTTFAWTNNTPSIGLAANGNGDIASFTALNTTSSPIIATITVTPTANGCQGPDSTFTITINPTPLANIIPNQVSCANATTNTIAYTSVTTGTTFAWSNDTPSIGLAANGNGDIASFTGLNTTSNPIIATITVTPTANGCIGPDSTFTITVNPIPLSNSIPDQILCANTLTNAVTYSSATTGTTFTWSNNTPSIGLAANGNGNIAAFTGLNATANPIIATITITPTANGCQGPDSTFTITVNPGPIVNSIADQTLCTNTPTSAITYSSATTGTTFAWSNDTPSIGLSANGNGNIAAFTSLNTTSNPIVATITITATGPNGCVGPDSTFTITVNPIPLSNSIPDQILCANTLTNAVTYSSATTGTTFPWTNDTPSIGLAVNGNGNIAAFTGLNTTGTPIIATITVTPTANGCVGPDSTFTITVNPLPLSNSIADQVLCANSTTNAITYSSATTGTTFAWTNNTPSIGLAANGNGNIASFSALNTSANPIVSTITVTPTANGCTGPDSTFTITINPTPLTNTIPDQVICANALASIITYSSATPGTTFSWTNDTPSIGLAANGNGNIASFTGLNSTSNPIIATITVTPTANGCVGPDSTFTITVYPTPLVNTITHQVLCANTATNTVAYSSATTGTTFAWSNDTPSIGLAANGNGNIASFSGLNASSSPIIATITVTPSANGCVGPDSTFTITLNPGPIVNSITDQILCSNTSTSAITYLSATPGTTFSWTNDTPSIGIAANGTGDIAAFTGLNTTSAPIVATMTVTPTANGCVGPDSTFTITVNPTPFVNTIANQVICANTTTNAINYTSLTPGTTFAWSNDTPSIGIAANGNGNIATFTGLNTSSSPIIATITVTPTANGCVGPDSIFTITVNPVPLVNTVTNQILCANTATNTITYSSATLGTTFAWTNDTPSIGLAANGNGDIPSFTALNTTSNLIIATITVTPSGPNGCAGPDSTFTITVNPTPLTNTVSDQVLCANSTTNAITYTSTTAGTTFTWTNDTPSIGIAANGNGDIPTFTALNTTSNPIVATITVTPTANGCVGPDSTFTITVNPTPLVNTITNQILCANTATSAIAYTSSTPGTSFAWTNNTPSIGLAANGNGNIASFTGLNTTSNTIVATITVIPTANGCPGPDSTFTITVNSIPVTNSTANQVLCTNALTNTISYTSPTPGTSFAWTNNTPSIGLAANGNGNIASFTGLNTTSNPIVATITVTPTANGCVGPDSTFTITVNPIPVTNSSVDQVLCANTTTNTITYSSPTSGTTFAWTNNTPSIGLAANGNGNIASFTGLNTTSNPIVATITVTPTANGCPGPDSTFTITINPGPIVNSIGNQVLCTNAATNAITYTSATPGTTFAWTNNTPSTGLATGGNGNIASFTALNTTSNIIIASITVTPTANGCPGPDSTFTITVNPIPVTNSTADQVLCANTATNSITYSSPTAGTTFAWTNDTPSIGIAANGNGNIAAFTGLNTTLNPIISTITVTPTANGCVGPDSTFTITINPISQVNSIADQVLCANSTTNAVNYTATIAGTTFAWTNDSPSIGLAANGNGNIAAFTGLNTTSNPIIATITMTPTGLNGCIGSDSTFTITINPTPLTNSTANQVLCANATTNTITYSSATPGATYTWTNDTPSIGLAANGNGNIASFTGLNTTSNPIIATITVTPAANGCPGPDSTFTITINPIPVTNSVASQVLCANTATNAITYSSTTPGTTFTWSNDTPSIGLAANGNGNIASFTGLNTTANPIIATITVTPISNGCVGPDSTFTITVNPGPIVNSIADQILCSNTTTNNITYTSATPGTAFAWTNDTPSIGLAANGNGNIAFFTGLNTTANPIIATITVTPTANGCSGPDSTFTITVNPIPVTNSVASQVLCANTATNTITYSSPTAGTTFAWTNDTPSIGIAANGNGDIASFTTLNATANPIVATITVTPTANGCVGQDSTFTITVNPGPIVNSIANQVLCNNTTTNAITYSSATPGTTFAWTNNTPSIGLATGGNGNIASFTALNTSSNIIIASITVTPTANNCPGPDSTFTITVNPIPVTNSVANQLLCANTATNTITYASSTPGAAFAWTNNTPSIGIAPNGNGNIASFTGLNTTANPIIATITVTPTANGCVGQDSTFTITVNPVPLINTIADQVLCANTITNSITYSSSTLGTTYAWTNDTPSIGIAASGNGNIASFTGLNTTSNPIIATITVIPTGPNGCAGPDSTFTITVNPTPITNSIADQVLCANTSTNTITYASATPGTTFAWTNDSPSIGLATNGNGNIASFTGLNTTSNPIIATITVTPTTNGCTGPDSTFTITVNPIPVTNSTVDQVLCANTATNTITHSSPTVGTTFAWANDSPSIGIPTNGNGDIASFTALNSTANPIIATITVTPMANGCSGPDSTFTITVNPVPLANSIANQVLCANTATIAITYTSATPGATFEWTNDTPSIGITANGNGSIASFTGLNASSNPVIATITVTPTANACIGLDSTFTITVNPIPIANSVANQVLCANSTTNAITYSSPTVGTTFSWTNNAPSIGLAAGGNGNIASFTSLNTSLNPIISTITVTPTANACVGPDSTLTITVNPIPIINSIPDQVLCANTLTNAINYTSTTIGATFAWTNDTPSIGLAANGSGNIAPFTAINTSSNPIIATITIVSTGPNGCAGPDSSFTITVNPIPIVDAIADQILCANTAVNAITYTNATPGTTFDWVNNTPSIGLAANGNGNIVSFTGLNTIANPIIATITVTPTANGCVGPDSTFTITVNPTPLTNFIANQVLCANMTTNTIAYSSATTGTTFNWTNDAPSIDLVAAGNGDITSFTALNNTLNPVIATIIVTPTANGCIGPDSTFTITVNPIPFVNTIPDQVLCANTATNVINYTNSTPGTIFSWTNTAPSIGLAAAGNGDIPSFTALNTTPNIIVASITVTPTGPNGCTGPDSTFTITVNPIPVVNAIANQVLCANMATNPISLSSATPGTTFSWSNTATSIGLAANGNLDIPSFTALNATQNPVLGTITVTPTANSCAGNNTVFTILVNNLPTISAGSDTLICVGDPVILSGIGAQTYLWNKGVINSISFIPIQTDNYTVVGTDINGCQNSDSIIVSIEQLPIVSMTASTYTGCEPQSITFVNTSTAQSNLNNCVWNFGDNTSANSCDSVLHTYPAGTFDLVLTVTSNTGCTNSQTYPNLINVDPLPNASFTVSETEITTLDTEVEFENTSTGASNYSWDFGDNSPVAIEEHPIHFYPDFKGKIFKAMLVAYSPLGCTDTAFTNIKLTEELIYYIPNAFTPTSTDQNNVFKAEVLSGIDIYEFRLQIFNRWGELMFESNDPYGGWNGLYNGEIVPQGVYVWKLDFGSSNDVDKRIQDIGHVTVLR